jgi:site-specific recombinase XerD
VRKRIGWHTARYTLAVLALEAGAELYTVSRRLGHTDIKTTQVYAKATDKLKRAAVDALPKLEAGEPLTRNPPSKRERQLMRRL